jgi:two-component system, chemotaxis family, protein-glutamate methylesterase/glutaminase
VKRVLRVLVVDDSAYVRKTIKLILSRSSFIEVIGIAGDGEEALKKVEELQPDAVTLDLMMPGLDGLGFLAKQMVSRPLPVIVVSNASGQHDLVLKALETGAVDFVHKPSALANEKILEMADELIEKLKMAASIRLKRFEPTPLVQNSVAALKGAAIKEHERPRMQARQRAINEVDAIVIGISTGGPQSLKYLIPQLPEDFRIPIAVALHIPEGFTEMYAAKLDELSELKVREAKEGDHLEPGLVLIAPGGRHLTFRREGDGSVAVHVDAQPLDRTHMPSVDVLFESAAETFGDRVLGIVMTGMGSDGSQGAARIKARGGRIYTEAEETCVVYGMPAAVVEAGLSDRAIPLHRLAQAMLEVS